MNGEKVLSVNLDGLYLLAHAFLPNMKEREWGRIIPVSSAMFHAGLGGRSHYSTSKAGMIGFVRALAREVGDFGITVNALAPGLVRTDAGAQAVEESRSEERFSDVDPYALIKQQQCIRKTLVPENLVGPLLFLASDQSEFVTGQTLLVDGGWQHV